MVHKGASTDIGEVTDLAINTDIASGFEGSGEIASIKEDTTAQIYENVTDQYSQIDIGADREMSQIQNTADTAKANLQNQINNIVNMFVGSTGEEWGGQHDQQNTLLEGAEAASMQRYAGNVGGDASNYNISEGMSGYLSNTFQSF